MEKRTDLPTRIRRLCVLADPSAAYSETAKYPLWPGWVRAQRRFVFSTLTTEKDSIMADIKTPFLCGLCGTNVYVQNDMAYRLLMRNSSNARCTNCMRGGNGQQWTKANYQEYLASDHWKRRRARAMKLARNKCQICGRNGSRLHVHHNNYDRLGRELDSDLLIVCEPHHKKIHGIN